MTKQEYKEDLLRRIKEAKNSEFGIKKIELNNWILPKRLRKT